MMLGSLLPGRLDLYLLRRGVTAIVMITVLIIVIALAVDFLVNIGMFVHNLNKPGVAVAIRDLYWYRLPQIANVALPLATVIGTLVVCAPMLKRGEFIALSAAGISPARAARVLPLLALMVGVLDTGIADLVTPHAVAHSTEIEDRLQNQRRLGRVWQVPLTKTNWFAARAQGLIKNDPPSIDRVVVAHASGMVMADQLAWIGGAWQLRGHLLEFRVQPDGRCSLYRPATIALEGDLALPWDPQTLYRNLLPRYTLTGPELMRIGGQVEVSYAWTRWSRLLIPLLGVLAAMPAFVRFLHRDSMVLGTFKGLAAAAVPVLVMVVGGMVADTSGVSPATTILAAGALALAPTLFLYWRWRL
jgi:lipopolysaccharide export LptBFGC system permease protein LptF